MSRPSAEPTSTSTHQATDSLRAFAETADAVAATTKKLEKTRILAAYLASLSRAALPRAAVYLTGRPFPESAQRVLGLGWANLADSVVRLTGADRLDLARHYDRSSDLGQAIADLLAEAQADGRWRPLEPTPTLTEAADTFAAVSEASGPLAKAERFTRLLERCDPLTAKYLVKIVSGELRIGLREGLLEEAVARAFVRPLADVQWAGMLTGDAGRTAELARDDRLSDAEMALFHPLRFMLASPAEDAAEIIGRLGSPVWVEDKYDGIRAQLHKLGRDVRLYSRDLHDVSGQFPEVVEAAADLPWDGILDGEILAFKDEHVLPFLQLQTRLGRKAPSAAVREAVPVIHVAFDLLAVGSAVGGGAAADGSFEPLLRSQLRERRRRLEGLLLPPPRFALSHLVSVPDAPALDAAFDEARGRGNEGLMVKDPDSIYSVGRRGFGWLKMKRALATIDAVVVGVEVGHGKRHGVLSDYTFAVRDTENERLVTIGKAYSGLTDAEIAEMTRWFEAHTLEHHGRYRVVEPTVVVEVAFDVIMRSNRHRSGFALRFPRIARLRPDKSADDIDTLETVRALYEGLQHAPAQLVTMGARTTGS
jgi:DNA ligase-1